MGEDSNTILDFGAPEEKQSIIKVIGVGGGGGNAVNHMYAEGIHDVKFAVCNTDAQALDASNVPVHIQLGQEGLGAGNKPEKARKAAEESIDAIHNMLNDGTRMAFITATMGGGTGTGAAPVVARVSKEMGILTVGIVTIPFMFEGATKIDQALDGVEEMAKYVDSLIVINNERLRDVCSSLSIEAGLAKADNILTVAAKSIAEIITIHGNINLDFNDVKTVLENGGVAIMSMGYGEGEDRVKKAIEDALNSPLLNNSDIYHSRRILLNITHGGDSEGHHGLMMEEMTDINNFMARFSCEFEIKWGIAVDPTLGDKVKITILATGFGVDEVTRNVSHHSDLQAKLNEDAAQSAEDIKRTERRRKYYHDGAGTMRNKRKPNLFIFSNDTLDNDEVINEVEQSPTFKRTRQALERISNMAMGTVMPNEEQKEVASSVISFG